MRHAGRLSPLLDPKADPMRHFQGHSNLPSEGQYLAHAQPTLSLQFFELILFGRSVLCTFEQL